MLRRYATVCARSSLWLAAIVAALAIAACDRDGCSQWDASLPLEDAPLPLRETCDHLRELLARRAYLAMRPYIDPEHRDDVIDLLVAMDELLAANAAAQAAIRQACPEIDPRPFDMSAMVNQLELFSRDLQIVSLEEDGDRAWVVLLIADQVPYERAQFERRDGRWVYLPGPGARDLTSMTRAIAEALGRVAFVVSQGPHTPEQIQAEYRLRVGRRLQDVLASATRPGP